LSALLIKNQNSKENSKTYLIMLSLTITGFQGIIPKLMALQRGWFRHVKKDFGSFIGNKEDWDLALLYITMGYRKSKHASLFHFSPYFLLFGRHPIPPFSIAAQMDSVVDLDSLATWAKVIAERDALFKKVMPMAMENLSIAQHRDTLRYAHTQGGNYKPKVRQFDVGDFLYLQRQLDDILDISSSCTILRIKVIRPSGVLELQEANRHTIRDHSKNCVPCHLPPTTYQT